MTLQLEKKNKTAVLSFGRHNPPTTGHEKLLNKVHSVAKQHGGTAHVVSSHSHDAHKNPVPQDKKLEYLRKVAHPDVKVSGSSKEHPTILHHASKLHAAGHKHLVVVAGGERVKEFHKTLNTYNGVKGKKHGHYNFKSIKVVSSGKRDPDSHGVEGISGTKMRDHAKAGRHKEFKQGLPKALHGHAKEIQKHVGGTQLESFKEALDRMRNRYDKKKKFKLSGEKTQVIMHVNPPAEGGDKRNTKPGSPSNSRAAGSIRFGEESKAGNVLAGTKRGAILGFTMGEDVNEAFEKIEEEEVTEVLTRAGRIKRGLLMRRYKHKIQRRKKMMRKKLATTDMLQRRSRRHAVRLVRKRFMGKKGENYAKLGMADKIMIDKRVATKKAIIFKIAQRLLPKVRRAELIRLKNFKQNKLGSASKSKALSISQTKQASSEGFVGVQKMTGPTGEIYSISKKDINAVMEKAIKHDFDADILFELFAMGAEQDGKGTPQQKGFQSLNTFIANIKKHEVNETMKDWQGKPIQGTQLDRRFNSIVLKQSVIPKLQEFKATGEKSDIEDPINPKTVKHDVINNDNKKRKKIKKLSELEYPHETSKKYKKDTPGQANEELLSKEQSRKNQNAIVNKAVADVRKKDAEEKVRIKKVTDRVLKNPKTKVGGVQNEDRSFNEDVDVNRDPNHAHIKKMGYKVQHGHGLNAKDPRHKQNHPKPDVTLHYTMGDTDSSAYTVHKGGAAHGDPKMHRVAKPKTKVGGVQNEDAADMVRVMNAQEGERERIKQQHEREMEQMDNSEEKKRKRDAHIRKLQGLRARQKDAREQARARLPQ
jgi:hypothetical protein